MANQFRIQRGIDYEDYLNRPYRTDDLIAKLKEIVEK